LGFIYAITSDRPILRSSFGKRRSGQYHCKFVEVLDLGIEQEGRLVTLSYRTRKPDSYNQIRPQIRIIRG